MFNYKGFSNVDSFILLLLFPEPVN